MELKFQQSGKQEIHEQEADFWANPEFAERAIKAAQELGNGKEWISLEELRKERAARIEAKRAEGAKSSTVR